MRDTPPTNLVFLWFVTSPRESAGGLSLGAGELEHQPAPAPSNPR